LQAAWWVAVRLAWDGIGQSPLSDPCLERGEFGHQFGHPVGNARKPEFDVVIAIADAAQLAANVNRARQPTGAISSSLSAR
jgi:hypothetical protein